MMKGEKEVLKAVESGNVGEIKRLIDTGASVNFGFDRDDLANVTPLMIAAQKGNVEIIDLLLKAGADVKAKDRHFMPGEGGAETALFYAVRGGHEKAIRALVRARSNLNAKACGSTPLSVAISGKNIPIAKLLIELGAKANTLGSLSDAILNQDLESVSLLLEFGANPDATDRHFGETPLMDAARRGLLEICSALLDHKANPNGTDHDGRTALMDAAVGGVIYQLKTEKDWARYGDHPRLSGSSLQTSENAVEIIELLLARGADINQRNKFGWSALMFATYENCEETIAALLKHGASKEGVEQAELFRALRDEKEGEEIYELSRKLPSLNMRGPYGAPLWEVAKFYNDLPGMIRMFIQMGMDPNITNRDGDPLLKQFIQSGDGPFVQFLVEQGANLRATDKEGKDASRWARGVKNMPQFIDHLLGETSTGIPERKAKDFSEATNAPAFQKMVDELAKRLGLKPRLISQERGGIQFDTPGKVIVPELHENFRARGAYLFECIHRKAIALLPTTDPYEVIEFIGTNGANYDLDTVDIINWMRELEKEQPFDLTGIGFDFLEGRFTTPVKNSRDLAQKLYKFCPDIVHQGAGTVAKAASELKRANRFFLWWD
jgi:ankyrin repeat protein